MIATLYFIIIYIFIIIIFLIIYITSSLVNDLSLESRYVEKCEGNGRSCRWFTKIVLICKEDSLKGNISSTPGTSDSSQARQERGAALNLKSRSGKTMAKRTAGDISGVRPIMVSLFLWRRYSSERQPVNNRSDATVCLSEPAFSR